MINNQYYLWKKVSIVIVGFIFLILFIFPTKDLRAQETSKERAKEIAEQFLWSQKVRNKSSIQQSDIKHTFQLQKLYQSPDSVKNILHGFQHEEGGFVFVLENSDNFAVVGYSTQGKINLDSIPEALDALLKTYEKTGEITPGQSLKSESATKVVEPLLDKEGISLNQFYHENAGNCPSGCVVTAMAQIMAYYKYPDSGIGSNCYTHPVYGEFCADFENTTYNWDNPTADDYKLLSFHLGVSMNMNYCGDEYGSIPGDWGYHTILQNNFKYYTHYGSSESFYLRNELNNDRPIYCELPGNPGHAVVLDGYDINEFFHINFGWGGAYNGYFILNNSSLFNASIYTFGTNVNVFNSSIFISPTPFITNSQDSLALVNFHNSMNATTGWDLTKAVVNWKGVIVMNERVISLKLDGLEGEIPAEIENLTELQNLNLSGAISGSLPAGITNLTSLKEMVIKGYSNSSNLILPEEIGNLNNLEYLNINNPKGSIPETIGNLTKLKHLTLLNGELTGEIPEGIYSLTNLEELSLGNNQLTGTISPKIGQLVRLKVVWLWNNNLSGVLPNEIGNLLELTEFRVAQNQFSGTIPETIGNWTKLVTLSLENNAFEGMLPSAISQFTEFSALLINNNKFTALPESIGDLVNLQQIVANDNLIESIPASLGNLSELYRLNLMNNNLTTLPDLGTMPALWDLNLSNNQITFLPETFGNLVKVADLYLDNNKLTELPSSFENLSTLRSIYLNANELSYLPISFALLSNLKNLYLQDNQIANALPPLNHLGLLELLVHRNNLVFNDFATSGMPEDLDFSDDYNFYYYDQAKVAVTDSVFYFNEGDLVDIDIRSTSRLSHPNNVYQWYKDNQPFQTGAVLKFESFTKEQRGSYFCRVTNPNYQRNSTTLETDPILVESKDDLLLANGFLTSSRSNDTHEFTDNQIALTIPDETRGDFTWQASTDSINWFDVSENMTQLQIKENILSIDESKIIVEPKSPVLFRYAVKEGTCDSLFSDIIKVNPFGNLLIDTMINVQNEAITISVDSIELVFPPNFTDNDFRLTITKLINPPTAPDSVSMGSVYDVNVSCGSVFDLPILIKFKNIDKSSFTEMDIDRYKAVYFDDKNQEWIPYENSGMSINDSTIEFYTNHLTKLSWFDFAHGSYTHIHTRSRVNIIYKWDVGTEDNFYQAYEYYIKDLPTQLWHNTNTDPDNGGTPYMIQDAGEYMDKIINKYQSLGLETPSLRFNVYVGITNNGAAGEIGAAGYLAGRGYFYIDPTYTTERDDLRRTLAHEYTHYTQDYYMTVLLDNYFWMEATAPLGDRMVWNESELERSEPEIHLQDALLKSSTSISIFDILSKSWDESITFPVIEKFMVNSAAANVSGTFLHYMRSYKSGDKLQPHILLKETPYTGSWLNYLDSYIVKYLNSNVGDQYEAYVKYIFEGTNKNFTLLNTNIDENPLKYFSNPTDLISNKFIKFNSEKILKDSVQLEVPYLATKMVEMYNMNSNQQVIARYKRKSAKQANMKLYLCTYDSDDKKMIYEDISENDSSFFVIESKTPDIKEQKNITFLLFINKDKSQNLSIDYELEFYPIPEFSMLDNFVFSKGLYGQVDLKIHSITDGTNETLDEFHLIPQVFRRWAVEYYSPMSYSSEIDETTIVTHTSSDYIEQTVTYNFTTGDMEIYNKENWGGLTATSTIDIREITMVLKNVWLTPLAPNSLNLKHTFHTNSTEETQNVIQSITYTRKHALWNNTLTPPAHDPTVTYTYLRTNYPAISNEWNFIKLSLAFW